MPLTIITARSMPDNPEGNAYTDHEQAMVFSLTMRFGGGTPKPGGIFPDMPIRDVDGADSCHIHAISLGGIIWRVAVTFMNKGDHVGNSFYNPVPTRSSTYSCYSTRLPVRSRSAAEVGDAVFRDFYAACPKTPGNTANNELLAAINEGIKAAKDAKDAELAAEKLRATASVNVSASKRDQGLFAQTPVAAGGMTDEQAQAKIDAYIAKTKVKIDAGDQRAIRVSLKEGRPKDKWQAWVQKYYDGIVT